MIYDPCDSACQPTCAGGNDEDCKLTCEEVCKCPDGQLLDGDECVPIADCGCTLPGGAYIKVISLIMKLPALYLFLLEGPFRWCSI